MPQKHIKTWMSTDENLVARNQETAEANGLAAAHTRGLNRSSLPLSSSLDRTRVSLSCIPIIGTPLQSGRNITTRKTLHDCYIRWAETLALGWPLCNGNNLHRRFSSVIFLDLLRSWRDRSSWVWLKYFSRVKTIVKMYYSVSWNLPGWLKQAIWHRRILKLKKWRNFCTIWWASLFVVPRLAVDLFFANWTSTDHLFIDEILKERLLSFSSSCNTTEEYFLFFRN